MVLLKVDFKTWARKKKRGVFKISLRVHPLNVFGKHIIYTHADVCKPARTTSGSRTTIHKSHTQQYIEIYMHVYRFF